MIQVEYNKLTGISHSPCASVAGIMDKAWELIQQKSKHSTSTRGDSYKRRCLLLLTGLTLSLSFYKMVIPRSYSCVPQFKTHVYILQ